MGKRRKRLIIRLIGMTVGLCCILFFTVFSQETDRELMEESADLSSFEVEDSATFGMESMIGVHIGMGEVLGKATLNNGGIPLSVEDHKRKLWELKRDFYPQELDKVIELINRAVYKRGVSK